MYITQKDIDSGTDGAFLYRFTSARFKAFVQIYRMVLKIHGPNPVCIKHGMMAQPIGNKNFLVEMDLSNLLTDGKTSNIDTLTKAASFDFIASEYQLKELSAITGRGAVDVYDQGGSLLFTDGHIEAWIFKPDSKAPHMSTPIIPDAQEFGEVVRDVDLTDLKRYRDKSSYVSLLCYGEQLEQVAVSGRRPYTLHGSSRATLVGREPDHVFTSRHFLALAGKLELSLGICKTEKGFWLKTSSRLNMVNALTTFELLYEGKI